MGDPDEQASQMADAIRRLQMQKQAQAVEGEQEVIEAEEELPERGE
jgi:hypothetical protein